MANWIDLSALESALESLKNALQPLPKNDRERDGAIQRFEYTFELAWKMAKRLLDAQGIHSTSPKTVIRDMAQQEWIEDAEMWLDFLDARNRTTHTYRATTANEVYTSATKFWPQCVALLKKLKSIQNP